MRPQCLGTHVETLILRPISVRLCPIAVPSDYGLIRQLATANHAKFRELSLSDFTYFLSSNQDHVKVQSNEKALKEKINGNSPGLRLSIHYLLKFRDFIGPIYCNRLYSVGKFPDKH